jgi:glycosyltransferase involved in cell wall biosynthesis
VDILFLSPHPFYQERGTPIAVDLVLRTLSERGDQVDVVTYHEGRDIEYDHVTIYRIPKIPFISQIRPGFSWKKLVCDVLMFVIVIHLVARKRYHVVYALEESVFMALILKWILEVPYVYDMDSSLAQQMIEKYPFLGRLASLFNFFEKLAVRGSKVVVPVCNALADVIEKYQPEKVMVLHDVPLLRTSRCQDQPDLRAELGIRGVLLLYVGNLESYQGIDLLLESFALVLERTDQADLAIIGGEAAAMQKYRKKSCRLGISRKVHFLGPKPVEYLARYLSAADILVSPRINGKNTPMKLYSYLQSGRPVLATDLPTHTQVIDSHVAMLAEPSPEAFSDAMLRLIEADHLRAELGSAGKQLVEEKFSYAVFRERLHDLMDWLETEVAREGKLTARMAEPSAKRLHG